MHIIVIRARLLPLRNEDKQVEVQCVQMWASVGEDELILVDMDDEIGLTFLSKRTFKCNLVNMVRDLPAHEVAVELDGTFKLTRKPA